MVTASSCLLSLFRVSSSSTIPVCTCVICLAGGLGAAWLAAWAGVVPTAGITEACAAWVCVVDGVWVYALAGALEGPAMLVL